VKVLKRLVTTPGITRFAPLFLRADEWIRCLKGFHLSHTGKSQLAHYQIEGADRLLAAMADNRTNTVIERERGQLLRIRRPLDGLGPYDTGVTVAAACAISKSPRQAGLLAALVREFQPKFILELGTNVGISSAYMASVTSGTLTTLEASAARLTIAAQWHEKLGLKNITRVPGLFDDTLDGVLERSPPVDFAFVDGHHQYDATLRYFERIFPHAKPGSVFVFDDIRWSPGMQRAWAQLCEDERFGLTVNLSTMGVGILKSATERQVMNVPIACY
jgi:predicted O-methyltransferase YrrM